MFTSVQTIHFLRPPHPKKSTHQHFLSAKIQHENKKNQAEKLKVYGKMLIFTFPPPPKVYVLYTRENVDIFGQLFSRLAGRVFLSVGLECKNTLNGVRKLNTFLEDIKTNFIHNGVNLVKTLPLRDNLG